MAKNNGLREELKPVALRPIQELLELDPEELTANEVFRLSLDNVLLVAELTSITGVGRVYKELLKLREVFINE